jgi:2-keto-4-pentenoate hydratase/2-oxohepta-3-ene-1,7-dioic acid hydratase in catechol pathway
MNIYCIGRNYAEHARELGNEVPSQPVVFLKSFSTLRGLNPVDMAFESEEFDFEAEIVLKVARLAKLGSTPGSDVIDEVALGLDLTRRAAQSELKSKGHPWTTAKSFKGSAVVSPFTAFPRNSLQNLRFEFNLNGEPKQSGTPDMMLFSFDKVINFLLTFNDLEPGDLIFTGTPKGVGKIRKGDKFSLCLPKLNLSYEGEL